MSRRSFIQRSYQTISQSLNNKTIRRAMLASLIAGSAINAAPTAFADNSDTRGGISILVHEFCGETTTAKSSAPAVESAAKASASSNVSTDTLISLGTHDSVMLAGSVEPSSDLAAAGIDEVADDEVADEEVADDELSAEEVVADAATEEIVLEELVKPAVEVEIAKAEFEKARTSEFNKTIAAAVAASVAKLGISIEQVLEPFAMVGPLAGPIANAAPATMPLDAEFGEKSVIAESEAIADLLVDVTADKTPTNQQLAEAVALNRWWLDTETVAVATASVAEVPQAEEVVAEEVAMSDDALIQAAIEALAAEEPLDVRDDSFEPSDVKLVGSSPMIVTIQDAYMPYDLAQRDLELNWLPLSTVVPIKPKNYVMVPEKGEVASAEVVEAVADVAVVAEAQTSPECLLDSLVHQTTELAERTRIADLTFASLGESFGDWVASLSPQRAELVEVVAPAAKAVAGNKLEAIAKAAPVAAAVVVGSAVLPPVAFDDVASDDVASDDVASDFVASDDVADMEAVEVATIAMMEVEGKEIPAPVADPLPNAPVDRVLEQIAMMEIDGEQIPAPVADSVPNASSAAEQIAVMEVDGQSIPAPVADPIPNGDAQEQIATADSDQDLAVAEPITAAESADAAIADLITKISQWQRQTINAILTTEPAAQETAATEVAETASETKLR